MPRILGVDIPNDKRTVISLRYIYGIGPFLAEQLCERAGIDPEKRARDLTEDDQGVGAHKDGGFVTILLQDVQEGLQVEYDGTWIAAPPVPGTFVINIGELLELASNGYLRATVHRAITPPAGTDRLSIGYFFSARLDASIPLLELPPELAKEQRGLTNDALNPLFYEVGKNLMKSRLRSHPDVAQRHHADLLQTTAQSADR